MNYYSLLLVKYETQVPSPLGEKCDELSETEAGQAQRHLTNRHFRLTLLVKEFHRRDEFSYKISQAWKPPEVFC